MKKLKKTLAIATLLTFSSIAAVTGTMNTAHALVGLLTLDAPLAIAGAAVTLGAGSLEACAYYCGNENTSDRELSAALAGFMLLPVGAVGLLLLNGDAGQTIVYSEINATEARKLGLSADQVDAYNSHLTEVNLVLQNVESDLAEIKDPTIQDSQAIWTKYGSALPAPAMIAVSRISQSALNHK